jgi:hypothetical protein
MKYKITRDQAIAFKIDPSAEGDQIAAEYRDVISAYLSQIGAKGGKIGGCATTPAKRRASRANGKLGGRPMKVKA